VNLLRAASDIIGGDAALARRLGIGQTLLQGFLADRYELPDALVLRAVDIILEDRGGLAPAERPAMLASRCQE